MRFFHLIFFVVFALAAVWPNRKGKGFTYEASWPFRLLFAYWAIIAYGEAFA